MGDKSAKLFKLGYSATPFPYAMKLHRAAAFCIIGILSSIEFGSQFSTYSSTAVGEYQRRSYSPAGIEGSSVNATTRKPRMERSSSRDACSNEEGVLDEP